MALCIECLPAVQEVSGSIPKWDTSVSMLYAEDVGGPGQASFVIGDKGGSGSYGPVRHTSLLSDTH